MAAGDRGGSVAAHDTAQAEATRRSWSPTGDTTSLILRLPVEFHRELRLLALETDTSLQALAVEALRRVLEERAQASDDGAQRGLAFHERVWRVVDAIPFGTTMTYGEVARAAGHPGGAQGVGEAISRHLDTPWWRVVSRRGLSTPPGWEQQRRLAAEGVHMRYATRGEGPPEDQAADD